MARPKIVRKIACRPAYSCFKPNGVPMKQLPRLTLASDELEALRLVDMQGLQQLQAAQQLGVSRQTLGNIIARGRHKVAQALVMGMVLELAPDSIQTTED
ncbi:DUF134 domain-containing protein [Photobacterium aquimaris]|uniref:UPF0251 protein C0W81_14180 n=1 Tax=Photobacterium aquimaris TaxID=512643 RepID=A0A2T3HVP4_9GAMM|nr:DUF134 domain-containing protein [Photobacterium aquimaris]OBU24533.1 hypothetical protein AYY21_11925 [Photobacterium aquimaris]PQJ42200.1 hypothetical protein BTN98_10140 [Photobacterium aquimaris]PSU02686.1 DUF134 domain-containing protein [Photobacterium aquimaris]